MDHATHDHSAPNSPYRIPLCVPFFDRREEEAVAEVVRSRWLTMGPRTRDFEDRVAEYLGVRHAILVANGTCALELAYAAVLERYHESEPAGPDRPTVLVPDITFVATANAAHWAGARASLVDCQSPRNPLTHHDTLVERIDAGGTTVAAAAVVHYAGFEAPLPNGTDTWSRNVGIVEDAAHAIGSTGADGRRLGTLGHIGCYSFFSNKNMATGEGGLLVTNDCEFGTRLRLLRSHGMTSLTYERYASRTSGYDVVLPGRNCRASEITAALATVQLGKLDEANARRRFLYERYAANLAGSGDITVAFADDPAHIRRSSCHILPALCRNAEVRDHVRGALREAGIETSHHYPPIHSLSHYAIESGTSGNEWPNATAFAQRQLTLPLHPALTAEEVDEVCEVAAKAAASVPAH